MFSVIFFVIFIKEKDLEKWTDYRYVFQIQWTGLGCGYEREVSNICLQKLDGSQYHFLEGKAKSGTFGGMRMCRILVQGTLNLDAYEKSKWRNGDVTQARAKGVWGLAEWSKLEMKVLKVVHIKMVLGILLT